jgi:hypothetical protein
MVLNFFGCLVKDKNKHKVSACCSENTNYLNCLLQCTCHHRILGSQAAFETSFLKRFIGWVFWISKWFHWSQQKPLFIFFTKWEQKFWKPSALIRKSTSPINEYFSGWHDRLPKTPQNHGEWKTKSVLYFFTKRLLFMKIWKSFLCWLVDWLVDWLGGGGGEG